MPRFARAVWPISTVALLALASCGEERKEPGPRPDFTSSVEAPSRAPVTLVSPKACALDSDCEPGTFCFQGGCARQCAVAEDCGPSQVCLERGLCAAADSGGAGGESESAIDVEPGIALVEIPERVQEVAADQELLSLEVAVAPAAPSGRLAYRIERSDGRGDPQQVLVAEGTDRFTVQVAAGAANPSGEDPRPVQVYVVTSAGAFELSLVPQIRFAGQYAGQARIELFGSTGLPIDFWIVTDPPTAPLSQATAAYVVMPVGREKLFSPRAARPAATEAELMTRPLTYDSFTQRWVAVFVSEMDLGKGSILSAAAIPGQVRRAIRLVLEPSGAKGLVGRISDRWTGLYDARNSSGQSEPASVVFEGELDMQRVGPAPELAAVTPPQDVPAGSPQVLPPPELTECTDAMLAAASAPGDYSCEGLTSLALFEAAGAEARASCAIAVARASLAGQTTAMQISAFLDGSDTSGESFADFMKRCAAGENGTCRPSQAVLCGRQMTAAVYAGLQEELPATADLVIAYQDTTREAFLGRRLGAFQTDAQTRLDWLKSSDYPAIVTSAVKDLVGRLLDDWAANVLDVHLGVVAGQSDPAGMAVLSRPASGAEAIAARKGLLLEMSQSWRGAADALSLGASRWNELYQEENARAAKAAFVSQRMFDLYLVAGLMAELNLASGASFASGTFAGGFTEIMRELGALSLPFDKLVNARDAEVVVSTSVDPMSDNTALLAQRRQAALDEIGSASTAVGEIIAQSQAEALSQAELSNRMSNEINGVRSEMVELCGLPVGCSADSYLTDRTCEVRPAAGHCGFLIQHETNEYLQLDTGAQSVSEAGSKLLALRDAGLSYDRAVEELRAHQASSALYLDATASFAAQVASWNRTRLAAIDQIDAAVAARQAARQDALSDLLANIQQRNATRREAIAQTQDDVEKWDAIRIGGIETSFDDLEASNTLARTAETYFGLAELVSEKASAYADGLPKSVGTSNDVSSTQRLAIRLAALAVSTGLKHEGSEAKIESEELELESQKELAISNAEVEALKDRSEVAQAISAADVAALEDQAELAAQQNANEEAALRELVESVEREAEAELAFGRDLSELNDRRTQWKQMLEETVGLELQVVQAELGIVVAAQDYLQVAQRAELRMARLRDLERQRQEINSLVGSPTAVFAWANRLDQAERRLSRAKDKLLDWLIALEYLAVRPFMDQRLQILLARNTYQLEAIAGEIDRLQDKCGGPVNRHVAELSLRDNLLDLGLELTDPVTGESKSPSQRLRALLERGYVPIDKRVRYAGDSSIGSLLSSRSVLAATFSVGLQDFANLGASCNAKVYSIGVELVGEGLGSGQPTVSILYDGASELRSCQPGLDDYLDTIGRETTAFGSVTKLHAPGRSVSPVAGINAFPSGTGNVSLSGLPLASQYTILIDPAMGENRKIDWSKLEDVKLQLEYTYQDLFPQGQCQ